MNFDDFQLPLHNPWWDEAFNMDQETKLKELEKVRFKYYNPFFFEFPETQDVVFTIRGPRRIGKTTLLKQLVAKLIKNKHLRQNILYFPCDRVKDFNDLYFLIQNFVQERHTENNKRLFLFIDEISSVFDWQRAMKALADDGFLGNTGVILTGSNVLDLKKSSERLPGRTGKWFKSDKLFLPLNFKEFYKLTHSDWDGKIHFQEIPLYKKAWGNYLLTGGFPNVINEFFEHGRINSETYETYIKWIEGDIEKEKRSLNSAYRLFAEIHKKLGSRMSYTEIARNAVLSSQKTVQEYLEIFKMMFVIFEAEFFSLDEKRTDPKKNKKIYFTDPFIHNALIAKENGFLDDAFSFTKKVLLDKKFQDQRFEETVGDNLYANYEKFYYGNFGSHSYEIDFVGFKKGKYDLFEVKFGRNIDFSLYEKFERLNIVTFDVEKKVKRINAIPFYKFFLIGPQNPKG